MKRVPRIHSIISRIGVVPFASFVTIAPADAALDYDKLKPEKTVTLATYGGVRPATCPRECVTMVRGQTEKPGTGVDEFRPGDGAAEENIIIVAGKEAYRKEPGGKSVKTPVKLEAGKKVLFKISHLIQTLRKESNAPKPPFVVASCGFNGGEGWEPGRSADTILNAQMNVSDPAK